MKEIGIDFSKIKLAPIGIISVEINDTKMDFICDTKKRIDRINSMLTIINVAATPIVPSAHNSKIHIVSTYINLDTKEDVVVHERTFGKVKEINSSTSNEEMTSFEIVIDEISQIEYTMEIKTRDEEIDDAIGFLKKKLEDYKIEFGIRISDERNQHKKDIGEIEDKLHRQEKEFKEFKDRIYKAFGIGELYISNNGISGSINLTTSNDKENYLANRRGY